MNQFKKKILFIAKSSLDSPKDSFHRKQNYRRIFTAFTVFTKKTSTNTESQSQLASPVFINVAREQDDNPEVAHIMNQGFKSELLIFENPGDDVIS